MERDLNCSLPETFENYSHSIAMPEKGVIS